MEMGHYPYKLRQTAHLKEKIPSKGWEEGWKETDMNIAQAFSEVAVIEITLRSAFTFIVLLWLTRLMGKKQLSQLSYFHYITGITIGSIAGEISVQSDTNFLDGMISLFWWFIFTILMSFILLKWKKARRILDDEPTIIIRNGQILESSLRSLRLHMDDVMMLLREQSIFTIQEVDWAVMENNGQLSVLKKTAQLEATKQDVKADLTEPKYFPTTLISDGEILHDNLRELDLDEEWLQKKLSRKGANTASDVFYAQIQPDGSIDVHKKAPSS